MTNESNANSAPPAATRSMDDIVALCRRRGFIWQSSEIYGGINGFWDYGPLGVELKRNLKEAWWHDIVRCPGKGPDGELLSMVGLDSTIIQNARVWEASGHVGGFNDPMVDDKETKQRFRADQLVGLWHQEAGGEDEASLMAAAEVVSHRVLSDPPDATIIPESSEDLRSRMGKLLNIKQVASVLNLGHGGDERRTHAHQLVTRDGKSFVVYVCDILWNELAYSVSRIPSPFTGKAGALTEPRQFNLMFETYTGAIRDEESKTYLRPETAQGIFTQFWNVVDTSRVKVPFGIAQVGKAFRNEVTPRNFTFRSREFEQMEIEFFIRPDQADEWYKYWRDARYNWWKSIGLAGDNLQLREHEKEELAHYAKEGAGVCDIEYRFPFTAPGFGELEGVAHRADFDLKAHANACGKGDKLRYFDQERNERYFPHVIEPSAGADRGTLALLCEAYTPDSNRPSGVYMKFHPRLAPIKAAIFPLVNKDGMPEVAEKLYMQLRQKWNVQIDVKQNIGKRYARMDEAGTPYCFTIDSDTLNDQTVTVRHRDTLQQERIGLDKVAAFLAEKIGG